MLEPIVINEETQGKTIAAILRTVYPDRSWTQIRQFIVARHVQIDGTLCMDPARRVKRGEKVTVLTASAKIDRAATESGLVIRHLDEDIVVVEKASGINTVRHPAERDWDDSRRALSPTLEDLTMSAIAKKLDENKHSLPRLRIVQRLDKETSGLVVFARSVLAERVLGKQFHAHKVIRRYLAVVPGAMAPQRIESWLVRDRGDGRRGSGLEGVGKQAITHVSVHEKLSKYTILSCRLETGRTHQIRIHLAEAGHPVCGEKVYNRTLIGEPIPDPSEAPRLALHATELGFVHPSTEETIRWEMALPKDLANWIEMLRKNQST